MKYAIECATPHVKADHLSVDIFITDEYGGMWKVGRWANDGSMLSPRSWDPRPPELVIIELRKVWGELTPGYSGVVEIEKVQVKGKEYLSIERTDITQGGAVTFTHQPYKKKGNTNVSNNTSADDAAMSVMNNL